MKNIYFFGECMIELRSIEESLMRQSFAGDVYNAAVYLKRCFPAINSSIVTSVGQDNLSDKMISVFAEEEIDTEFVFKHDTKIPGMYLGETDDVGERSFTYWRSDAAARYTMELFNDEAIAKLKCADMFFFSGISLAIIKPELRDSFWQMVWQLKDAGVQIVFDPNYRARLWASVDETKLLYDLALQVSDIVLPGIEDFNSIYGHTSFDHVKTFCKPYNIKELVIKDGPNGVLVVYDGEETFIDILPVENVVDTNSAGDSFNGAYLGSRLTGRSITDAVQLAAKAAGTVIQYPGAIIPKEAFDSIRQ